MKSIAPRLLKFKISTSLIIYKAALSEDFSSEFNSVIQFCGSDFHPTSLEVELEFLHTMELCKQFCVTYVPGYQKVHCIGVGRYISIGEGGLVS